MVAVKSVFAPYIYVCTRMRVRKSKLIPREEYMRMLNMSLPEITRIIQETEYKEEIDELSSVFKGIDLIEVALELEPCQRIPEDPGDHPGKLKTVHPLISPSLGYPERSQHTTGQDAGRKNGEDQGDITYLQAVWIGAFLDRLLTEDSVEKIVEALKGKWIYKVISRELPVCQREWFILTDGK